MKIVEEKSVSINQLITYLVMDVFVEQPLASPGSVN